jgi:hypothetical protein
MIQDSLARRLRRPEVHGKYLFVGSQKLLVRGTTYGTFRPDPFGNEYGRRDQVERDLAAIAANGFNALRTYTVPPHRNDYAGIVLTLARQETPDMAAYTDAEIATTIRKDFHAGLIVRSAEPQRVEALLADYTQRFYRDFFATAPPPERPVE